MIWTVIQISVRRLLHSRSELLLTFGVPIVFFSIFAVIFGSGVGSGKTPSIEVVTVDEVRSPASQALIESLRQQSGLRFVQSPQERLDRRGAQEMVRQGTSSMAIVLRPGAGNQLAVDLLADSSDQVASQVVASFVTRSMMLVEAHRQIAGFDSNQTPTNPELPVRSPSDMLLAGSNPGGTSMGSTIKQYAAKPAAISIDPTVTEVAASVTEAIQLVDVMGEGKTNPVISMYAAGIAVMFLLFGATGGGGMLLEERENQTLERLLSSHMTMDQLLLGKWFYMTALGVLQVTVMFLWAQYVFQVDLLGHWDGFLMMTLVTALAASGFGLFLATLCRTRGQLNGLSVILVLSMSALGGSMVPRYLMSEGLQRCGLFTFNAWALDGYNKVFWRDLPVSALAPQLSVLLLSGIAFLLLARVLALRWETE